MMRCILDVRDDAIRKSRNPIDRRREVQLMKQYGLTVAEFDQLLESQNYKCAICGKEDEKLVVDYAHDESRKVRGLLCTRCNSILGGYENALKMINAIRRYLRNAQ